MKFLAFCVFHTRLANPASPLCLCCASLMHPRERQGARSGVPFYTTREQLTPRYIVIRTSCSKPTSMHSQASLTTGSCG